MDVGYSRPSNQRVRRFDRVAEEMREYDQLSVKQLNNKLDKMENTMYEHARNLEFEEAAKVRDEIHRFKDHFFKNPVFPAK
jgi:excinuclease ABC subunit B